MIDVCSDFGVGVEVVARIGIKEGGRRLASSLFVLDEEISWWHSTFFGCV